MWDTLFSEDESGCGFEDFQVFVCAAFLKHFSDKVRPRTISPKFSLRRCSLQLLALHAQSLRVFVCVVLLFGAFQIQAMAGDELMVFLQELPTQEWGKADVETLLSEAFILSTLYKDSPNHLAVGAK